MKYLCFCLFVCLSLSLSHSLSHTHTHTHTHTAPHWPPTPALTSPLHSETLIDPVVVSAVRVHRGPLVLQDVLLAVPVLGVLPPQLGQRPELAPVAVEAHGLFSISVVSVQEPHPLSPIEEMTLALRILQEMRCRDRIDLVTGADSWGEANEG